MVYAYNAQEFAEKMSIWEENIKGITVKLGSGERARLVSLDDYWAKNWKPDQDMWARFERKSLPLGQEHTTNR